MLNQDLTYEYWQMQRYWGETKTDYEIYMEYEFNLKAFLEWLE